MARKLGQPPPSKDWIADLLKEIERLMKTYFPEQYAEHVKQQKTRPLTTNQEDDR